ncbi:MAG TPA: hypothetical protein VE987_00980, partial [Polyangiaceae bacterium]|nr:hypothetical protein [Polyangiaceae bacterium]
AVGGGLHAALEALAVAALLVEAGDAERIVVVGVDWAGPMTAALAGAHLRSGAVAVLVSADARGARARVEETTLRRGAPCPGPVAAGHLALLPLAGAHPPRALEGASPPDAWARVALLPL